MSTRERWTVYPLLFLALGLAVRATVFVKADRVECRELVVRGVDGTILLQVPPPAVE